MKRPLFLVCLTIVLLTAVRMWRHPPSPVSYGEAAGTEVSLTGRVYAKEFQRGKLSPVLLIYLKPLHLTADSQNIPFYDNFICSIKNVDTEPPVGSLVTVRGILTEYEAASNPGQFDAAIYYRTMGISAAIREGELTIQEEGQDFFKEGLWQLRNFFGECLDKIFLEEDAAILKTMLLGDRAFLDGEIKKRYREAGILHILAISGLHITILGMGIYKLLRRIQLPVIPAAMLAGAVMLAYGMMAGMPVSARRAVFMFLLRLLADCIGRTYDMLTALLLCGAVMVIEQPLYLYHSGFLLSFLAVAAVGVLKPQIVPSFNRFSPILDSFFTSLAIAIFTLPVQLWFYHEVSVYGVFFNLVVLPLVGVVLSLGVWALTAFFLLPPVTGIFALFLHMILASYEQGCIFTGSLPGSLWTPGKPYVWQILCFLVLVFAVIFLKKLKWKYRMGLLCGAVLLFGIRERDGLTVTFLDVGQGDCICMELPDGSTWLADGGSLNVSGVGTYRIEPFLKSRGIDTLDAVFLSHSDKDHINGVEELLENGGIKIELLALPCTAGTDEESFTKVLALAEKRKIPVLWLVQGMEWECGGVTAVCLHPAQTEYLPDTNAASEVLYFSYGAFTMLLTGDVEKEGEENLLLSLQERRIEEVTVLKVAHHGSKYSTGEAFLQTVRPRFSIISAGHNNFYGHPHEETLYRLHNCGTRVYQTPESGAVIVKTDGERIRIEEFNGRN